MARTAKPAVPMNQRRPPPQSQSHKQPKIHSAQFPVRTAHLLVDHAFKKVAYQFRKDPKREQERFEKIRMYLLRDGCFEKAPFVSTEELRFRFWDILDTYSKEKQFSSLSIQSDEDRLHESRMINTVTDLLVLLDEMHRQSSAAQPEQAVEISKVTGRRSNVFQPSSRQKGRRRDVPFVMPHGEGQICSPTVPPAPSASLPVKRLSARSGGTQRSIDIPANAAPDPPFQQTFKKRKIENRVTLRRESTRDVTHEPRKATPSGNATPSAKATIPAIATPSAKVTIPAIATPSAKVTPSAKGTPSANNNNTQASKTTERRKETEQRKQRSNSAPHAVGVRKASRSNGVMVLGDIKIAERTTERSRRAGDLPDIADVDGMDISVGNENALRDAARAKAARGKVRLKDLAARENNVTSIPNTSSLKPDTRQMKFEATHLALPAGNHGSHATSAEAIRRMPTTVANLRMQPKSQDVSFAPVPVVEVEKRIVPFERSYRSPITNVAQQGKAPAVPAQSPPVMISQGDIVPEFRRSALGQARRDNAQEALGLATPSVMPAALPERREGGQPDSGLSNLNNSSTPNTHVCEAAQAFDKAAQAFDKFLEMDRRRQEDTAKLLNAFGDIARRQNEENAKLRELVAGMHQDVKQTGNECLRLGSEFLKLEVQRTHAVQEDRQKGREARQGIASLLVSIAQNLVQY